MRLSSGSPVRKSVNNNCARDHLSVGLDEFLRRLGWEERVLAFAALVRVFTLGQAARLIWEGNVYAAESILGHLVWKEQLLGRIEDIALPKGCGRGKTQVYYLTSKGAKVLARVAPSLIKQARPGRPRGANRARIPHELLVAEAYLWLAEQYEVFEFWPETELKRRIGQARATRERRFVKGLNDEATGDFKALVIARSEGEEERWIHGEVVVRYDASQVENKPDDVLWFVRDPRYVDLVEYIKGCPIVLLGDVRAPLAGVQSDAQDLQRIVNSESEIILSRLEKEALSGLDAVGGMATAEALAVVLGKYRTHMSRALKALEAKGNLRGVEAQLVPGRDTGRPMRLYMHPENQIPSVWEKIKGLIRSRMMTEMAAAGYGFFRYDGAKDEVEFKDATCIGKAPITVVVDDPQRPVEHLAERITAVRSRRQWPIAAVQSAERADHLRKILTERTEPILICDVVNGRESELRTATCEYQKAIAFMDSRPLGERINVG